MSLEPQTLRAELVGTVIEVSVQPGSRVAPSDTVVVLASMKMEIPVLADVTGFITNILVSVGDVVREGDALAVLTPDA